MGFRRNKTLLEKAQDVAEQVAETVLDAAHEGLEKAAPLIERGKEIAVDTADRVVASAHEGAEKAAPLIADGKKATAAKASTLAERVAASAHDGADKAAPLIADGKKAAAAKAAVFAAIAAEAAETAKAGAQEKVATLTGEPAPKKKGGKFKKFLLLTALAGLVAVVAKKLTGDKEADKWQSAYTPPPAPAPKPAAAAAPVPAPPAPEPADDNAGGDPTEALADAAEEPHAVTTPDDPAEVVDIPADPADEESHVGATDEHLADPDQHDVVSDPLVGSDEPAPYKPGKTGEGNN